MFCCSHGKPSSRRTYTSHSSTGGYRRPDASPEGVCAKDATSNSISYSCSLPLELNQCRRYNFRTLYGRKEGSPSVGLRNAVTVELSPRLNPSAAIMVIFQPIVASADTGTGVCTCKPTDACQRPRRSWLHKSSLGQDRRGSSLSHPSRGQVQSNDDSFSFASGG